MKLTFELVDRVKQDCLPNVGWHHANHWGPNREQKVKWEYLLSDRIGTLDFTAFRLRHGIQLIPLSPLGPQSNNLYKKSLSIYTTIYFIYLITICHKGSWEFCVMVHICIYVYVAIHVSKEKLLGFHQFLQRIFIMKKGLKHTNIERTVL